MTNGTDQLDIFAAIQKEEFIDRPYRNGNGELLPWEEPEYLLRKSRETLYTTVV